MRPSVLDEHEQDELGPGSDLVLSLFAMCLLLLAIAGVSYSMKKDSDAAVSDAQDVSLRELKLKSDKSESARTKLEMEFSKSTNEFREKSSQLTDEASKLRKKIEEAEKAKLNAENDLKTISNQSAIDHESAGRLQTENDKLKAQLSAATNVGHTSKVIELNELDDVVLFKSGETFLTEEGARDIYLKLRNFVRTSLPTFSANLLIIEGHASPERAERQWRSISPKAGDDGNLDLSAERAVEVAHFLHWLGIPYECVSISGHGSNRTRLTQGELRVLRSNHLTGDMSRKIKSDRRILISAVSDAQSQCAQQALNVSLQNIMRRDEKSFQIPAFNLQFSPACPRGYNKVIMNSSDREQCLKFKED